MKRSVLGVVGVAAVVALASALAVFANPFNTPVTHAAASPVFEATFDTSSDFFDRFDFGYSGLVAPQNAIPVESLTYKGDHDMACEGPTTSRDVTVGGTPDNLDFSQLFWFCAPKGPASGHMMTAVDTLGYNIAWFSPKPMFTNVSQVCWDINETIETKWSQVVFVSAADSVKYPVGSGTDLGWSFARGTGGFDLGFVNPDFRATNGPTDGIIGDSVTSGFRDFAGSANFFQGANWLSQFAGPTSAAEQITDKAARFKHCLTNGPNNTVILTKDTVSGTVSYTLNGQIPQGSVRVVFQDDAYDPPKRPGYDPNNVTWHWDNIQVHAGAATVVPAPPHP